MDIKKETQVSASGVPTAAQLEAINAQARAKMNGEQVYVFSVRLCDDQVDRDGEKFDTAALPALAKLFIGKTGIVDHKWSSDSQVARIFATEVVKEDNVAYIKAWAYIRRGGSADEVIADIEAGIKKEVSVGCAMGRCVCSICGSEYGQCGHQKGEYYDGQLCCGILKEPMDAYEFSFVAVPAQRDAGVIKGMGKHKCLKELAEEFGAQQEYRSLYKQAELGKLYEKQLRDDVVRLCLVLELGAAEPVLRGVVDKAAAEDLMKLKDALESRMRELMPVKGQLPGAEESKFAVESGFLI
ncbi:MAG: hypothetical protein IJO72_03040 [Oscillospiraceae bacterium]|nr:hypothetical protein [Oscillospiraceae bacterium]MBQ9929736.1 hypothetical protein [Oscillospiraceae bacterium]